MFLSCPGRARGWSWSPERPGRRYRRERERIVWTRLYFCYGKVGLRMHATCVSLRLSLRDLTTFVIIRLAIRNRRKNRTRKSGDRESKWIRPHLFNDILILGHILLWSCIIY